MFTATIPTSTFQWANRVNLCLISEDGALVRIIDQPVSSVCHMWRSQHQWSGLDGLWNNNPSSHLFLLLNVDRGTPLVSKALYQMTSEAHMYDICNTHTHTHTHTHTRLLTNTDFSLYFVSGSSGALKHWSISPQVSCEIHTVV